MQLAKHAFVAEIEFCWIRFGAVVWGGLVDLEIKVVVDWVRAVQIDCSGGSKVVLIDLFSCYRGVIDDGGGVAVCRRRREWEMVATCDARPAGIVRIRGPFTM